MRTFLPFWGKIIDQSTIAPYFENYVERHPKTFWLSKYHWLGDEDDIKMKTVTEPALFQIAFQLVIFVQSFMCDQKKLKHLNR